MRPMLVLGEHLHKEITQEHCAQLLILVEHYRNEKEVTQPLTGRHWQDTLHFRHYLLGVRFHLRTDYLPLTRLRTMKDPHGRRGRMLSDMVEYDFEIEHIKGHNNVVADVLSRLGFGEPTVT